MQRPQDVFVAGPLAFVNEPASDEPHERVPPEDHLHDHMDDCREIVVAANVAEFVQRRPRADGRVRYRLDVGRYLEDRTPQSTDARFHQSWHGANGDVIWNGHRQSGRTARSNDASKTTPLRERIAAIAANPNVHASRIVPAETGASGNEGTGRTENAPAAETRETHPARAHTGRGRHCGETQLSVDRGRWRTPSLAMCAAMPCDVEEPAG